jgi:hypothetical protein
MESSPNSICGLKFFSRRKFNSLGMRRDKMKTTGRDIVCIISIIFVVYLGIKGRGNVSFTDLGILATMLAFLTYSSINEVFSGCRTRTCLDFTTDKEVWPIVELWAKKEGCKLQSQTKTERVYRKGIGYLLIRQNDDKVHIEAWVKNRLFKYEAAADEASLFLNEYQNRGRVRINTRRINKLLIMLRSPVKIRESCKQRTRLDFISSKKIWRDVERWAKEEGYKIKSSSGMERIYKKKSSCGSDLDLIPVNGLYSDLTSCFLISQNGDKVRIEAWIEIHTPLFHIVKHKIAVDEADLRDRKFWKENMARLNNLLAMIGSPTMVESS